MAAKIVKGPQTTSEVPMGLGEYFFENAEKYGNRAFQINVITNESATYSEVRKRSVKIALYLQKNGIKHGDVVMLLGKTDVDNMVAALAVVFLGATVSSLDLKQELFDIKHYIDLVKPKIMIIVEERLELIEEALREIDFDTKIVVIGGSSSKYLNMYDIEKDSWKEEDMFKPYKVNVKEDAAFILFSSGTTGMPKAVLWSHFTALYGVVDSPQKAALLEARPNTSGLGLGYNRPVHSIAFSVASGVTILKSGIGLGSEKYFEEVHKYQMNSLLFTAAMVHRYITIPEKEFQKFKTSTVKLITVIGSSVDAQYILMLRKRFPNAKVVKGYGSTELGSGVIRWAAEGLNGKFYDMKPDSSGIAANNVEVKVIDIHTGDLLGPNQQGEILVKTPSKMLGYYNSQTPPKTYDEDGFYRTGDLGYYDDDEYFYFVDRISDIYKYRSHSICPVVIEIFLMKHPAIKEAIVGGIPHQVDEFRGAACVVLNEGFDITVEDIDSYISENLGDVYRLRGGVKFVEEIPKTISGKLQRRFVREVFLQKT